MLALEALELALEQGLGVIGGSALAGRPGVLVVLVAVAVPRPRSQTEEAAEAEAWRRRWLAEVVAVVEVVAVAEEEVEVAEAEVAEAEAEVAVEVAEAVEVVEAVVEVEAEVAEVVAEEAVVEEAEEEIRHEKAPGSRDRRQRPGEPPGPGQPAAAPASAAAERDRSAGAGSPGRMHNDARRRPLSVRGSLGQLNGRFHRRLWGGLDHPSVAARMRHARGNRRSKPWTTSVSARSKLLTGTASVSRPRGTAAQAARPSRATQTRFLPSPFAR